MNWPPRKKILILGERNYDLVPFEQRRLLLEPTTIASLTDRKVLNEARAVVVSDHPKKFALINDFYSQAFAYVRDRGLAVVVVAHNPDDLRQVRSIHPTVGYLKASEQDEEPSWIVREEDIWEAAETIARHKPGPPEAPPRDIETMLFEPTDVALSDEDKLILKRAFWDCNRLFLTELGGGRASMCVFKVHAWFVEAFDRPRPLPFFVKIADPESVEDELGFYREYVEHYLPFNLRPQLAEQRCVRTRQKRALIGTFVDHAVDLRTALRSGQGIGILFSLFETSLRGFRAQPLVGTPVRRSDVLEGFVSARAKLGEWVAPVTDRFELARDEFGLVNDPSWIVARLGQAAREVKCLIGPTHGDLHYGNVMVRGGDAILIDFASIKDGPLTSDPAALEVSLMFGTDEQDEPDQFEAWGEFIDEIYGMTIETLHPPALFESQPGKFSWLRRSLRELRHVLLGCSEDKTEAKIVLAGYLLRYARLPIEDLKKEGLVLLATKRHAYALVIAERLALSLPPPLSIAGATT